MTVYLLHFDRPISPGHTSQHYIGYTANLTRRLREHGSRRGGRLTHVAKERGIGFRLVRTWPEAGRREERELKEMKMGPRLGPECSPGRQCGLSLTNWSRPKIRAPRAMTLTDA